MNKIIESFLNNHINEYELKGSKNENFEHFINYIVMRNFTSRHFNPDIICTDEGEIGLDGVAIVANDTIVTSIDEMRDILSKNNRDLNVDFIFTQAKTSEGFESGEISLFLLAVKNFFQDRTKRIRMNDKMDELTKISDLIFENAIKLSSNPVCHLFYATTGVWNETPAFKTVIDNGSGELKQLLLFSDVSFMPYDQNRITTAYREIKNSIKKQISIEQAVAIPDIKDVEEAYIGIVKCKDYVNLITNEDGQLMVNLFEDNIRYFQGFNMVNMEISDTLNASESQMPFALLNNGITVVAKEIRRSGNNYILSDFQIVNGCQTSFVLYENREKLHSNTCVVVKLVATKDPELTGRIIKATNRQTPVQLEAFETLRDFHKNLELMYGAYDAEFRLFYERRSKQYDSESINKNKVVSFSVQISAYLAMFLGEPQSTHRYYGEILEANKKKIFKDDDILEQYCISTIYLYFVEKWLADQGVHKELKQFKYHIILLLRLLVDANELPRSNSNAMKKLCEKLYSTIRDKAQINTILSKSIDVIREVKKAHLAAGADSSQLARTREFTRDILKSVGISEIGAQSKHSIKPIKKGAVFQCKVTGFNKSFVYLEIVDHKEHASVHIREITDGFVRDIGEELKNNDVVSALIIDENPHPQFGYEMSIRLAKLQPSIKK